MDNFAPVVDITSLNGVESVLRRRGATDPWGQKLAGRLADFFVYSDVARFTMPVSGSVSLSKALMVESDPSVRIPMKNSGCSFAISPI